MNGQRPSATLLNVEYHIPYALLKKTGPAKFLVDSLTGDLLVRNRNIRTAFLKVQLVLFSRRHLATKTATPFAAMLHISDEFRKSSRWQICLLLLLVLAVILLIIVVVFNTSK